MDDISLDMRNAAAISRCHERSLMVPQEQEPETLLTESPASRITAGEAKKWADDMWGQGSVSLVWRGGKLIHRVGYFNEFGATEFPGEGLTWDEAVTRAGGDPEEIEQIRERGQG